MYGLILIESKSELMQGITVFAGIRLRKMSVMLYKLEIYAPEAEVIPIRDVLIDMGIGVVGNYDSVISIVNISGFWRPNEDANPVTGQKNKINFGEEVRIEVCCPKDKVKSALIAIKGVHPYEEPVINIIALANHEFE